MSDGITDMYREMDQVAALADFYRMLAEALKGGVADSPETMRALRKQADIAAIYPSADRQARLQKLVTLLKNQDKETWAKTISKAAANLKDRQLLMDMIEISPFKGTIPLDVNYGVGFVNFGGAIEQALAKRLENEGRMTYDADKYMLFIPREVIENAVMLWVKGNGTGPMRKDRRPAPAELEV